MVLRFVIDTASLAIIRAFTGGETNDGESFSAAATRPSCSIRKWLLPWRFIRQQRRDQLAAAVSAYKIVTGLFSITKIPPRNYRDSRMERRFIETPAEPRPFHDGMSCAILLAATAPFASSARVQTRRD